MCAGRDITGDHLALSLDEVFHFFMPIWKCRADTRHGIPDAVISNELTPAPAFRHVGDESSIIDFGNTRQVSRVPQIMQLLDKCLGIRRHRYLSHSKEPQSRNNSEFFLGQVEPLAIVSSNFPGEVVQRLHANFSEPKLKPNEIRQQVLLMSHIQLAIVKQDVQHERCLVSIAAGLQATRSPFPMRPFLWRSNWVPEKKQPPLLAAVST